MTNDAYIEALREREQAIRDAVRDGAAAEKLAPEYAALAAAIHALSADRGEAVWSYCPECGSDELHHAEGVHKQCKRCKQEWFSDVDYTRAVRANLGAWMDRKEATQPSPAAPSGVSDAVVDRFMSAFNCEAEGNTGTRLYMTNRENVRAALEAAQPQPGRVEGAREQRIAALVREVEAPDEWEACTHLGMENEYSSWFPVAAEMVEWLRKSDAHLVRKRVKK